MRVYGEGRRRVRRGMTPTRENDDDRENSGETCEHTYEHQLPPKAEHQLPPKAEAESVRAVHAPAPRVVT
jgi:hypothetical protein